MAISLDTTSFVSTASNAQTYYVNNQGVQDSQGKSVESVNLNGLSLSAGDVQGAFSETQAASHESNISSTEALSWTLGVSGMDVQSVTSAGTINSTSGVTLPDESGESVPRVSGISFASELSTPAIDIGMLFLLSASANQGYSSATEAYAAATRVVYSMQNLSANKEINSQSALSQDASYTYNYTKEAYDAENQALDATNSYSWISFVGSAVAEGAITVAPEQANADISSAYASDIASGTLYYANQQGVLSQEASFVQTAAQGMQTIYKQMQSSWKSMQDDPFSTFNSMVEGRSSSVYDNV